MKTLGFGIVGLGSVAPLHIGAIESNSAVRLAAVADSVEERAASVGREKGVAWYTDYRRMLENPDVDVVCVCTPSGLRGRIAIDAASAGKHVVAEKPLETTLEKADAIIRACDEAGVKLAVALQSRMLDGPRRVKQDADEGRLGRLLLGDAYVKWYRPQSYYESAAWRGTWEMDGGGALINQGIHYIDLLRWIMGPVESVCAYTGTVVRDIEVEDTAVAIVKFANGAMGVIEASTACKPGFPARVEIRGENGVYAIEDGRIALRTIEDGDGGEQTDPVSGSGANEPMAIDPTGHQRLLADVIDAIREDRPPFVDGRQGRQSIELIMAVYEAARTGSMVRLGQAW